jgi:2-methylcitrate dehydratase PrpD
LAIALGLDVSCGIALASSLDWGWRRTAAIGVFGATAAAGKLIGLMPEQILSWTPKTGQVANREFRP